MVEIVSASGVSFRVVFLVNPSLFLTLQGRGLVLTGGEWEMMEKDGNSWL